MKVLVVDDNPMHIASACQTLKGHDFTCVSTYDEAYELLAERRASYEAVQGELKRRFGRECRELELGSPERMSWFQQEKLLNVELLPSPSFEVVLSDLLMPASQMTMGTKGLSFVGQEMPVGFAIVMMAAIHGVKWVAVATDANHHDHPASAWLDPFKSGSPSRRIGSVFEETPPRFQINGTKVGFYHSPMCHVEGTICPECGGTGEKNVCHCVERNAGSPKPDCDTCHGTGRQCWTCRNSGKQWGKDWGAVLEHLVKDLPED